MKQHDPLDKRRLKWNLKDFNELSSSKLVLTDAEIDLMSRNELISLTEWLMINIDNFSRFNVTELQHYSPPPSIYRHD